MNRLLISGTSVHSYLLQRLSELQRTMFQNPDVIRDLIVAMVPVTVITVPRFKVPSNCGAKVAPLSQACGWVTRR